MLHTAKKSRTPKHTNAKHTAKKVTKKAPKKSISHKTPTLAQHKRFFSQIGEGSDAAFQPQKKAPAHTTADPEDAELMEQIDHVVKTYPVVLFMKGTPDRPMCGFSSRVVQILSKLNVSYESCNVLDSPELREGVKAYSNWPTLPQLYVSGEFVGGCDIVTQMYQSGELQQVLPAEANMLPNATTTTTPPPTANDV